MYAQLWRAAVKALKNIAAWVLIVILTLEAIFYVAFIFVPWFIELAGGGPLL